MKHNITFKAQDIKLDKEETGIFKGYASVFNILDAHNDIILPGAFTNLEDASKIKLLWQHDATRPIGQITEAKQTEYGLFIKGRILNSIEKGREAYELVSKNAIEGLSIGFEVLDYYYDNSIRYITKLKLWEISIVTFPANEKATINEVKSKESIKTIERLLDECTDKLRAMTGGRY